MPATCFTSPFGRGRRVAPGEGLRTNERPYPLTPTLSPWERGRTAFCERVCAMTSIDHLNPPTGAMADNVVGFARALRAAGIPVGPGAVIDALDALQVI